jgi:hypothetical protein
MKGERKMEKYRPMASLFKRGRKGNVCSTKIYEK